MQYTRNYNLKKPDYTDFADIEDINDNMDKLDEELAAPTGDTADSKATFTCSDVSDGDAAAWTNVPALTSGETHKSLFAKMSQMFKNIRFLYKLLGTTDISNIGNGTVTNALSVLNAKYLLETKTLANRVTFSAGAIGSYAEQLSATIVKEGYSPMVATLANNPAPAYFHLEVQLTPGTVFARIFRATNTSISIDGQVTVRVLYVKN